ncbi:MAG: hypothetical protein FJZ47_21420 [Candidatus Tectomicrobia bacterium]|uniref:Uncharacterized protein n=1 Tax=Tectimicrobiota bacterium TaxID=2528274 RepID=A0A938B2N7_UNCTE|nr:hypothetical protein [Candidatus Tectomicrobia bacterium]
MRATRPDHPAPRYILCHGVGGDAELLLEAARVLGEPALQALALQAAYSAVADRRQRGGYLSGLTHTAGALEDLSLFLVRCLDRGRPKSVPRACGGLAPPDGQGDVSRRETGGGLGRPRPTALRAIVGSRAL